MRIGPVSVQRLSLALLVMWFQMESQENHWCCQHRHSSIGREALKCFYLLVWPKVSKENRLISGFVSLIRDEYGWGHSKIQLSLPKIFSIKLCRKSKIKLEGPSLSRSLKARWRKKNEKQNKDLSFITNRNLRLANWIYISKQLMIHFITISLD